MKDDFGILSFVPNIWEGYWMPRHYIMSGLAKNYKIIWISRSQNLKDTIKHRFKAGKSSPLIQVDQNFWRYAPTRYLPYCFPFSKLKNFDNKILIKKVRKVLIDIGIKRLILYLWRPEYSKFLGQFNEEFVCYHIDDEYSFSDVDTPTDEREKSLIQSSDFVFIHSKTLLEKKGKLNPETHYIPNGVDFEHYRKVIKSYAAPLEEMKYIPRPRVGYVGWIKKHIDLELLVNLARKRKDWSFVLVGPINKSHLNIMKYIKLLKNEENVYFLGGKKTEELPKYINELDVCLMCYRKTAYTNFIYPMKLNEYLACGKPVVASHLENLTEFKDVLDFADSAEDWGMKIQRAIDGSNTDENVRKRLSIAMQNSWQSRVEKIHSIFQKKIGNY